MSIDTVKLEGSAAEMGRQHGDLLADGAAAMCETRIELCLRAAPAVSRQELLALAGESLPAFASFCPETYAEFSGIAEGAGLSPEELLIGNGYTDFVDLVRRHASGPSECTFCAVGPEASADGKRYVGQTWDMSATAFPHVVAFQRVPKGAPASLTVTTAGCLSLIGVNEHGIAVGNTNLTPHDARPGVMYLATIHTVLAQTSFEAAVRVVTEAPRMSGHFFYIAGPAGELAAIETTALRHTVLEPSSAGILAHANHYVDPELVSYVGQTDPSENSLTREARMWELLDGRSTHNLDTLWSILRDHDAPLCRHAASDTDARTCAAAILSPTDRLIRMARGNPCEAGYVDVVMC